ncbi:HEAT repeat domain-containing protein [Kineococcus sp. SYSU DK004]|uniref:HEAT repeat domain-containing protein n=1 Tax=Kineococcus sp. SYSU DK004 TaxID=3383125 RepID=UPI003D7EC468
MGLVKRSPEQGAPDADRREHARDRAGLLAQLHDADPEARRRAALDLADDEDALPALLAAVRTESVPAVRDALLTGVAEHDTAGVARSLAALLGDDDAAVRNAVVVALQTMPRGAAAVVDDLLADDDVRVRTLAVMVLSSLPHARVGAWLEAVVDRDGDENVVAAAVDAAQLLDEDTAGRLAGAAAQRFPANPYLGFLAGLPAGGR